LFFGNFQAFPCALCAQQGQLRWPARKRGTALLFQFVVAAFAAKNGVSLLLSLAQREKSPRSYPFFFPAARKRGTALLLQPALAAFTALKEGFLLLF